MAACALIAVIATAPTTSAATSGFVPPSWLLHSERFLLVRTFGNAKPTHVYYIRYPQKIAVVFEFNHVVVCDACSHPYGVAPLGGKVIRVAFDRRSHQLFGAPRSLTIRFCEVTGNKPPKSACLHR
jgi:hypothetical protein